MPPPLQWTYEQERDERNQFLFSTSNPRTLASLMKAPSIISIVLGGAFAIGVVHPASAQDAATLVMRAPGSAS